ncbi:hypothetical protein AB4455_12460 [Vibrio sp. 10N.261.46.E12]|uniref:hypothetical protein n=1 Tax=unclassified Vibrio TaxID=2614977 RepID=UPI0009757717|nr:MULTISPECIES: hypothetical protein [unclassified Vibrio]OMO36397.1 hypothetical protein BH584_03710 [Vibrio sp. 10N.261.45.E1]PMJ22063.1 hypothetical protein BCU27_16750 [Vibrio sp. 10N.286.45.B6]PML86316.1 hypothetical protein BCT66_14565 [Vibrio sp. 10N.261.49.E11]PMM76625.1 hypothetical protein BCT48_02305 [Vibrio sp. 10N.261.46.F12]PMM86949.1 hypothetical protein BCT46_07220 [Vibrio sp. 10N.261.46.E8]
MQPYARQYDPASNAPCPCGSMMCRYGHLPAPKGVPVKNKKHLRRIERKTPRQQAAKVIRKEIGYLAQPD